MNERDERERDTHADAAALPGGNESGVEREWRLPTVTEDEYAENGVLVIEATFLGLGSARRNRHFPHAGVFPTRGESCGYCRWFESRIFRVGPNEYVLHHVGRTLVPTERNMMRHERAFSPQEVIERYTIRGRNEPFLSRPGARALAQASAHDDDLRDAYENRAVL